MMTAALAILPPAPPARATLRWPDPVRATARAFAEFRAAVDSEVLIAVEMARLEEMSPMTVDGRWYPARSRIFALRRVAARNVRRAARERLQRRLIAIERRGAC